MTSVDLEALRARLDEAEAEARGALAAVEKMVSDETKLRATTRFIASDGYASVSIHELDARYLAYIAAWQPARVLALIARDRATLDRHAGEQCPCTHEHRECVQDGQDWPCPDVVAVWSFWMETPA